MSGRTTVLNVFISLQRVTYGAGVQRFAHHHSWVSPKCRFSHAVKHKSSWEGTKELSIATHFETRVVVRGNCQVWNHQIFPLRSEIVWFQNVFKIQGCWSSLSLSRSCSKTWAYEISGLSGWERICEEWTSSFNDEFQILPDLKNILLGRLEISRGLRTPGSTNGKWMNEMQIGHLD